MKTFVNYTGRKYGLLTVMDCISPSDGTNKGGLWLCGCKCGKTITLQGYKLYHRESCGCKGKQAARQRGINNRHHESVTYRIEHAKYKREYKGDNKLSMEKWKLLVHQLCYYCENIDTRNSTLNENYKTVIPLTEVEKLAYQVNINEIIEIDNKPVSCCRKCKNMRRGSDHEEFCNQVSIIAKKLKNKKN